MLHHRPVHKPKPVSPGLLTGCWFLGDHRDLLPRKLLLSYVRMGMPFVTQLCWLARRTRAPLPSSALLLAKRRAFPGFAVGGTAPSGIDVSQLCRSKQVSNMPGMPVAEQKQCFLYQTHLLPVLHCLGLANVSNGIQSKSCGSLWRGNWRRGVSIGQ